MNFFKLEKILVILIFSHNIINSSPLKEFKKRSNEIYKKLFTKKNTTTYDLIIDIIQSNSNETNFEKYFLNNTECVKSFSSAFRDSSEIFSILDKSDLAKFQTYNTFPCIDDDKIYLFFKYFLCDDKYCESTYSGVCLPGKCKDFYNSLLNRQENEQFFNFFKSIGPGMTLTNYQVLHKSLYEKSIIRDLPILDKIILCFIVIYIFLRFFIAVRGIFLYSREDFSQLEKGNLNEKLEAIQPNIDNGNAINRSFCEIKYQDQFCISKKKKTGYKIFTIFSFVKSYTYLNRIKSKIYNDEDIEFFLLLKSIGLFCIVGLFMFINKNYLNSNFTLREEVISNLSHPAFFIIKLLSYSFDFSFLINGAIFSYKLMNYIKLNRNNLTSRVDFNLSLKDFIYFLKIILTKIFIFLALVLFYLFAYDDFLIYDIRNELINDNSFGHIPNLKTMECYKYPYKLFIPILLDFKIQNSFDSVCSFGYLITTVEFNLLIFHSLLFYLLLKFKSKKIEFLFVSLICIILISPYFLLNNIVITTFRIATINITLKPYLLLPTYFLGTLIGVTYFMYKNVEVVYEKEYIPFKFLNSINKFFFFRSKTLKFLIIFFSSLLILLLSGKNLIGSIFFNQHLSLDNDGRFFKLYESKIFCALFTFILLMCIYLENTFSFLINGLKFFYIALSRNSMIFLLLIEFVINTFNYMEVFEYEFNYFKFFAWTFNAALITNFLAFLINILLEMPIRIFFKKILFKKKI
jgi:hypothetical protein